MEASSHVSKWWASIWFAFLGLDVGDQWDLIFTLKETDYDYNTYTLEKTDVLIKALIFPLKYMKLAPAGTVEEEGPSFQLVLFEAPEP